MPDAKFSLSPAILDAFADAFLLLDGSGRPLYANQAAENLFDLSRGRGRSALRLLHRELELAKIFQERDCTAIQQRKLKLGERLFLLSAYFEGDSARARLALILRDISDLRQLAADYSANAAQLVRITSALRHLASGLLITDAWGRIAFFNPALEALLPSGALARAQGVGITDIFAFADEFSQDKASKKCRVAQHLLLRPDQGLSASSGTALAVTRTPLMHGNGWPRLPLCL